jgi:hypothetical protein
MVEIYLPLFVPSTRIKENTHFPLCLRLLFLSRQNGLLLRRD